MAEALDIAVAESLDIAVTESPDIAGAEALEAMIITFYMEDKYIYE